MTDPTPATIRPEIELILCAARATIDPAVEARVRRLAQATLDWDYLTNLAHTHGMLPLLHQRLERHLNRNVEPAVRLRLQELFDRNASRNLFMTAELLRLLEMFKRRNLPAIAYKGPALAAYLYGDYALRRIDDLDLMVRKSDVWRAAEALASEGFEPATPISRSSLPIYFRSECDLTYVHRRTRLVVELHWAIAPPYYGLRLQTDDLFRRIRHVGLAGFEVPMPAPESLLIALCVHGAKHLWERLEWLAGVAALTLTEFSMDWECVLRSARSTRSERTLLLGLSLAHELLETRLPDAVLTRIRADRYMAPLCRTVRQNLFAEKRPGSLRQTAFRLRTQERIVDRVRYCALRAWTPTYKDVRYLSLPPALSHLYYLFRPLRLVLTSVGYLIRKMVPGLLRREASSRSTDPSFPGSCPSDSAGSA
jgi:hypothetical protein